MIDLHVSIHRSRGRFRFTATFVEVGVEREGGREGERKEMMGLTGETGSREGEGMEEGLAVRYTCCWSLLVTCLVSLINYVHSVSCIIFVYIYVYM